ncbi:unnamed protein product [Xylocopa violacea]|uniref:Uncharacterized protein n=1 Tax=Xylocopa violacea TaxID=135666 RepID=A0ABP1NCM9_XYLVO
MKVSLAAPLILLVFLAQCSVCYPAVKSRCPPMSLANGRVRGGKGRGKFIRYSCNDGFTLIGNKYSNCIRGEWDTPKPACVNAECPQPPLPKHAVVASKYDGAVLIYFCESGYALIGSPEIFCNGRQWNSTTPYCRDTTAAAPTQCDFEKPDLCWWEQDPLHDFDWQRHNFETPSYHIGTGPSHDHTLGPENDGYYLYIEASSKLVNDTARIISPIYNASYTESGCFSFWYHMYGATVGALRVYFKQEQASLPRLMFSKEGDQGNQWLHGLFSLPKAERGFQIIIEGVRGSSYVSDIAIDDVAILQGDKCREANKTDTAPVTESNYDQIELVNAQQSCRGRCKNSVTYNFTTSLPPTPFEACLCTLDCAEHSICCPDYVEYCVLWNTDEQTTDTEQSTVPSESAAATTRPPKEDTVANVTTVRTGSSIILKDDIDPVTLRSLTSTSRARPSTSATRKEPERPTKSNGRATPAVAVVTTTTTRTTPTKEAPFVQPTTVTRYARVDAQPTNSVTRKEPERSTKSNGRATPAVVTAVAVVTTTTTRTTPTKEAAFVRPTTATRYARVDAQPDSNARRQDPEKVHQGSKLSWPGIIGMVVGILAGVLISSVLVIVILRRRKTYKRGTNGSALSEDSDVRFLTSDEILDFTLARPSENEETLFHVRCKPRWEIASCQSTLES